MVRFTRLTTAEQEMFTACRASIRGLPTAELNASSLRTTISTRLSGVDAPDVSPTRTSPGPASQPVETTSRLSATERCRISSADTRPSGPATWKVGTCSAQIRARLQVLLLL